MDPSLSENRSVKVGNFHVPKHQSTLTDYLIFPRILKKIIPISKETLCIEHRDPSVDFHTS